jgi:broad specificity phosphatase PhoE
MRYLNISNNNTMQRLKWMITLIVCFGGLITAAAQTTTVWIVRHAEKDTAMATRANPDLNAQGQQRAKDLATYLQQTKIAVIFSTDTKRTKQTAAHFTAPMELYNPRQLSVLPAQIMQLAKGKTVLLIGHSNTVLETIEALGGQRPVNALSDDDYDYIFRVEMDGQSPVKVQAFQYGAKHRGGKAVMQ